MAGPGAGEFAMLTGDDLVTGEAVALDLPAAGLGSRLLSGLIDLVVTGVALFVVFFIAAIATVGADEALGSAVVIVVTVLIFVAFPVTFETLTRGRSLGKLAMGLRTVRDDAGPITFQHALIRATVGFVEIYSTFAIPAFFSMLLNRRGKRLGDLAAGTYVVRDRVSLTLPLPPVMPPPLAAWAAGADISDLPTGLALAVRQYLGRAGSLTPAAREELGGRLSQRVSSYVAPPPPAGTPPEAFLAAVVATRRERDLARLRREEEQRVRLTRR